MKKLTLFTSILILTGCYDVDNTAQVNKQELSDSVFSVSVHPTCPDDVNNLKVGEIVDPYSTALATPKNTDLSATLNKLKDELVYFYVSFEFEGVNHYQTYNGVAGEHFDINIVGSCTCDYRSIEILNGDPLNTYTINSVRQEISSYSGKTFIEDAKLCENDTIAEGTRGELALYKEGRDIVSLSGEKTTVTSYGGFFSVDVSSYIDGSLYPNRHFSLSEDDMVFTTLGDTKDIVEITYPQLLNNHNVGLTYDADVNQPEPYSPTADYISVNMGYGVVQYSISDGDYLVGNIETQHSVNGENPVKWHILVSHLAMNFNTDLYFPNEQEPAFAYAVGNDDAQYELRVVKSSGIPYMSAIRTAKEDTTEFWLQYSGFPF